MTSTVHSTTYRDLAGRFALAFGDVARGEPAREAGRHLPFAALEQLRSAGLGAVTVPVDSGGAGAGQEDVLRLLMDLAAVDVNTALSDFLATPGKGVGINDREGVAAGDSYTRTYNFTRYSGRGGKVDYDLRWVGNDGTFSAPASVSQTLRSPARFLARSMSMVAMAGSGSSSVSRTNRRVFGSIVVSRSCEGFISPSPLNRWMFTLPRIPSAAICARRPSRSPSSSA